MNSTYPAPPCVRRHSASGFTLIEILAAVSVLLIGLAAIVGLLYGSFAQGHVASDRNAAAILIPAVIGGNYYRTRYRLEKHTDWWPHDSDGNEAAEQPGSAYRGVYVLSIAVYRDPEQDMSKAVQVSDPVVTYLRDRRAR